MKQQQALPPFIISVAKPKKKELSLLINGIVDERC